MLRFPSLDRVGETESLWYAAEYTRCLELLAAQPPSPQRALLAARCCERLRRYDDGLLALGQGALDAPEVALRAEAVALAALLHAAADQADASGMRLAELAALEAAPLPHRVRVQITHDRAVCAWMRGDFIEAETLVARCEPPSDLNAAARASFLRSWIRWSRGKTAEQTELLLETLALLDRAETPDVGLMARAAFALSAACREYNLPDAAAIVTRLLQTIPWTADVRVEHFQTLRTSAWAHALQAEYIPAIRLLHAARDVAPSAYFGVLSRFDRAWVSRIAGERASCEAEALSAAEIALGLDWTATRGEESTALLVGAEMLAHVDADVAERLYQRFEGAWGRISPLMAIRRDPKIAALAAVARASIAAARNDVDALRRYAKSAFDIYDSLGVQWRSAACALLLYRAGCGEEWLRAARANVGGYTRSFIAEEIARLERQRRNAQTGDLTARQREIFTLLMDGLSIDDVADRLVCSRNTVRIHVGAIYRKFG